ncbi:hypothetical protein D0T60_05820 [Bacteroides sp. 224]|nr:hypothetical protein [Bacteroides sp. 224]
MDLPADFFQGDLLELEGFDKFGRSICTWTWPVKYANEYFQTQQPETASQTSATIQNEVERITLTANHISVSFHKEDGSLMEVKRDGQVIPLTNGPLPVGMKAKYKNGYTLTEGNDAVFIAKYTGAIDSITWRMTGEGLLGMTAVLLNRGSGGGFGEDFFDEKVYNFGFSFSFPEKEVKAMRWMGRGPYRVWKNRIKGTNYNIWEKEHNNTVTSESFESLIYPEFKGYHANLYWATLESEHVPFTVYSESDGLFFRVFTPEEPVMRRNGENSMHKFPEGDISFLYDIPAMRSFKLISEHGPKSQPSSIRIKQGDEGIHMKLWFDFR